MNNKIPISSDEMEEELTVFNQRFNEMRKTKKLTDCSFKIEDKILDCHKLILTASSPVFEAMFYGSWAETESVKISDIKLNVFDIMLDFIYTGKIDFDEIVHIEEILELYYCAQKYMIDSLQKICIKYLGNNIKPQNVLKILDIAYSMSLDDIIFSLLYVLRHWLSNGWSFSNCILDSDFHVSKSTLMVILQENRDNFKENIICLLRSWCIVECEQRGLDKSTDNMKLLLKDFKLTGKLINDIVNRSSAIGEPVIGDKYNWVSYQRIYHKAVRPLIIGDEMDSETNISANRFIVLKSINMNSRLIPPLQSVDINDTYTENVVIEISSKADVFFKKHHIVRDVEYNTSVEIKLHEHVVLFPDTPYIIRIKWDASSLGYEYPRSIYSTYGKSKQFRINFSESMYLQSQGSVLNGIMCDLYK